MSVKPTARRKQNRGAAIADGSDGFSALKFSENRLRDFVPATLLRSLIDALPDPGFRGGLHFDLFAGALWHGGKVSRTSSRCELHLGGECDLDCRNAERVLCPRRTPEVRYQRLTSPANSQPHPRDSINSDAFLPGRLSELDRNRDPAARIKLVVVRDGRLVGVAHFVVREDTNARPVVDEVG